MWRPLVLLLILGTLGLGALCLKDAKEPVYAPTVAGTTLVYQLGDHEFAEVVTNVEKHDGDLIVHIGSVDSEEKVNPSMVFRVGKKGVFLLEESGQQYNPPWCMLKLPATPDETWETKSTRKDIGNVECTSTVGKAEKITLPAGTFMAIPVTVNRTIEGNSTVVYWYVADVGWAKITSGGDTIRELKSVKVNSK